MPGQVLHPNLPLKPRTMLAAGLALLAGVALMGDVQAQDIPPEFVINQSGWQGGARARSEAGEFSHCDVRRAFEGDRILIVSLNRRNEINIGLIDPTFEFEPTTGTSAVRIQIDQSLNARVPAAPGGQSVLVLAAGDSDQLMEALRLGNVLVLETEYGTFQFPLSGTFNAFGALRDCIAVANQILPPEPDREELAANGPPGIGRNAMATLLQASGIEGALLVPEDQLPDDEMELSQIWLVGEVVGGLHQRQRESGQIEIEAFVEDYLTILGARCQGEFEAMSGEIEILDDRYAFAPVDMVCTGDTGTSVVTALFVLDDNFYSVFFHEGDEAIADQVATATDAITVLVRQLAVDSLANGGPTGADAEGPAAETPAAEDPEVETPAAETPDDEATSQDGAEPGDGADPDQDPVPAN